jgi:hypothetical protein
MTKAISICASALLFIVVVICIMRGPEATYLSCANIAAHGISYESGSCKDAPGGGIMLEPSRTFTTYQPSVTYPADVIVWNPTK